MNLNIYTCMMKIKKLCKQRSVRLTPQRLAVLYSMSQCNKAISAYDLLRILQQSTLPNAKPSTIYRALHFLLEQGFIHRIESTNRFMLCRYFFELSHNFVFFICNSCKQVTEHSVKGIEEILYKIAKLQGFIIFNNIIETHGLCITCIKNT